MNVVDSSGWLEHIIDGDNADFFAAPLTDVDNLLVPTVSVLEVFKLVLRRRDEETALRVAAAMRRAHVIDLDAELAVAAARLGLDCKLSLADSIIYATARAHGATLWTQDAHFQGLDGVRFTAKKS